MNKKVFFMIALSLMINYFYSPIKITLADNIIVSQNNSDRLLKNYFNRKISNQQIQGQGIVIKLLKDDLEAEILLFDS